MGRLGAVTAASFAWSVHATATSPSTAYFSTFTRAWELGVGALIAVGAAHLDRVPAGVRAALAWTGLGAVVVAAVVMDDGTPFPGTAAALPVLGAAALVAFGSAPGGPGARWLLGSPPARFVGDISYSLYLWHWPVLGYRRRARAARVAAVRARCGHRLAGAGDRVLLLHRAAGPAHELAAPEGPEIVR